MNLNLTKHRFKISKGNREIIKNQQACTIWMSGLSGSGKSTIADRLEIKLYELDQHSYILDGDNTRLGLNKDLKFSDGDRIENIRRVSEVAKLMNDAGLIVICSFISPFEINRDMAREIIGNGFIEVYIDTNLEICEKRDPKGLYKKARSGEIKEFTGISSPFEVPTNPDLILQNHNEHDLETCVDTIIEFLKKNNYIYVV